jgi:hypothetical protein
VKVVKDRNHPYPVIRVSPDGRPPYVLSFGRPPEGEHEDGPPDDLARLLGVINGHMCWAYMLAAEELANHGKPPPAGHRIAGDLDTPETCPRCVTASNLREQVRLVCGMILDSQPRPGTAAWKAWRQAAFASLHAFDAGMHYGRLIAPEAEKLFRDGMGAETGRDHSAAARGGKAQGLEARAREKWQAVRAGHREWTLAAVDAEVAKRLRVSPSSVEKWRRKWPQPVD